MGNTKRNNIQQKQGEWGGRTDAKYSREGGGRGIQEKGGSSRQAKKERGRNARRASAVRGREGEREWSEQSEQRKTTRKIIIKKKKA